MKTPKHREIVKVYIHGRCSIPYRMRYLGEYKHRYNIGKTRKGKVFSTSVMLLPIDDHDLKAYDEETCKERGVPIGTIGMSGVNVYYNIQRYCWVRRLYNRIILGN